MIGTGADLHRDSMLRLALERVVTVLGEAAGRLPGEWREAHPQAPWALMIGMRNRLIHGYDDIALDTLWDTAANDLPELIRSIDLILAESDAGTRPDAD